MGPLLSARVAALLVLWYPLLALLVVLAALLEPLLRLAVAASLLEPSAAGALLFPHPLFGLLALSLLVRWLARMALLALLAGLTLADLPRLVRVRLLVLTAIFVSSHASHAHTGQPRRLTSGWLVMVVVCPRTEL